VKNKDVNFVGCFCDPSITVKEIRWIPEFPMLFVMGANNQFCLVGSSTFIRVLCSEKFHGEYMKIWETRQNDSYEKWSSLTQFEVDTQHEIISFNSIKAEFLNQDTIKATLCIVSSESIYYIIEVEFVFNEQLNFQQSVKYLRKLKMNVQLNECLAISKAGQGEHHFAFVSNEKLLFYKLEAEILIECWSIPLNKSKIKCRMSDDFLGVLKEDTAVLYLYDIFEH
jgi:hypothetical protein